MKNKVIWSIKKLIGDLNDLMDPYIESGFSFMPRVTPVIVEFGDYKSNVIIDWDGGVKFKANNDIIYDFKANNDIIYDFNSFSPDDLITLYYELKLYEDHVVRRIEFIESIIKDNVCIDSKFSCSICNGHTKYYDEWLYD